MRFSAPPSNCLFANVSVKTKPYSSDPVSIRVSAHNYPCPANKALFYAELPLQSISLDTINAKIQQFMLQNNNNSVVVKMQPKVLKIVQNQALS